jgi:hypothetical protein
MAKVTRLKNHRFGSIGRKAARNALSKVLARSRENGPMRERRWRSSLPNERHGRRDPPSCLDPCGRGSRYGTARLNTG